jgi:hypothetical protein
VFRVRLTFQSSASRLSFRVSPGFRVVNGFVAIAILGAGWALGTFEVPVVLASLAVLGALYEESATFDASSGRAEFRVGLLVWYRIRAVALDDIVEVRLSTFGAASFVGFEVGLRDGRTLTVENDRGKAATERLSAWAQELAQWLRVPLVS